MAWLAAITVTISVLFAHNFICDILTGWGDWHPSWWPLFSMLFAQNVTCDLIGWGAEVNGSHHGDHFCAFCTECYLWHSDWLRCWGDWQPSWWPLLWFLHRISYLWHSDWLRCWGDWQPSRWPLLCGFCTECYLWHSDWLRCWGDWQCSPAPLQKIWRLPVLPCWPLCPTRQWCGEFLWRWLPLTQCRTAQHVLSDASVCRNTQQWWMTDVVCSFIIISTDRPPLGEEGRGMIKQTDALPIGDGEGEW